MKILVMSDMHGHTSNFERAIEKEKDAKNIIFLEYKKQGVVQLCALAFALPILYIVLIWCCFSVY